jgi:cytochrome c oxidase cbb3-type subunit 2
MPAYPWMADSVLDGKLTPKKLEAMRTLGVPYTEDDITNATSAVQGKTEMDALIAYLQVMGTSLKSR